MLRLFLHQTRHARRRLLESGDAISINRLRLPSLQATNRAPYLRLNAHQLQRLIALAAEAAAYVSLKT